MTKSCLLVMSSVLGLGLVACGDDGGSNKPMPDAPNQIDAAIDSPAAVACPAPTLGAGMIGTMAAPDEFNYVHKTMAGMPFLSLGFFTAEDEKDAFTIVWPKPAAGFAPGTYTFDTDPNSTMPAALSFFEGGLDPNNPMADAAHFLWATSGTLTITSVSKTGAMPAGENPNDVFAGSASAIMYREIDGNGMVIAGGCTVSFGGFSFFVKDANGTTIPTPDEQPVTWRDTRATRAFVNAAN